MTNQEAFQKAIKAVNSGRYSYEDDYWIGAVSHLGFELKYSLDKEKQSVFTQKAVQILKDRLKEICNNPEIKPDTKEHKDAFSELADIIADPNHPVYTERFIRESARLRRILICIEYIKVHHDA